MFQGTRPRPPGSFKNRYSGETYDERTVALPSRRKWETAFLIPIAIVAPPVAFYLDGASAGTVFNSTLLLFVTLGFLWPFISIWALLHLSISNPRYQRTCPRRRRLWLEDPAGRNKKLYSGGGGGGGWGGDGGDCGGHGGGDGGCDGAGCASSLSLMSRRTLTVHVAG